MSFHPYAQQTGRYAVRKSSSQGTDEGSSSQQQQQQQQQSGYNSAHIGPARTERRGAAVSHRKSSQSGSNAIPLGPATQMMGHAGDFKESAGRHSRERDAREGLRDTSGDKFLKETPCHTLFVRNIPFNVELNELRGLFERFGPIRSFFDDAVPRRGLLFVTFDDLRDALRAKVDMTGYSFGRRSINVHFSLPKADERSRACEASFNQSCIGVLYRGDMDMDVDGLMRELEKLGEIRSVRKLSGQEIVVDVWSLKVTERVVEFVSDKKWQGGVLKGRYAWNDEGLPNQGLEQTQQNVPFSAQYGSQGRDSPQYNGYMQPPNVLELAKVTSLLSSIRSIPEGGGQSMQATQGMQGMQVMQGMQGTQGIQMQVSMPMSMQTQPQMAMPMAPVPMDIAAQAAQTSALLSSIMGSKSPVQTPSVAPVSNLPNLPNLTPNLAAILAKAQANAQKQKQKQEPSSSISDLLSLVTSKQ